MEHLPTIYAAAVLLPLASFVLILLFAQQLGRAASVIATGAILLAGVLSFVALGLWLSTHFPAVGHHEESGFRGQEAGVRVQGSEVRVQGSGFRGREAGVWGRESGDRGHAAVNAGRVGTEYLALSTDAGAGQLQACGRQTGQIHYVSSLQEPAAAHAPAHGQAAAEHAETGGEHGQGEHGQGEARPSYTGEYYTLAKAGPLRITISYYIDALTVLMFCMVTFIATCIHFYASGYMADELTAVNDKEVVLASGQTLHRPGRYPRFFQYLSLFCFSMLGLILAGNIAMVFVFWELVGICSYFLIGFYIERRTASTAANKAFIVNRVGDFGMIIGLMVIWSTLGTFAFGDIERTDAEGNTTTEAGIFSLVRPGPEHGLIVPDGMVQADAKELVATADGKKVYKSSVEQIMLDHASSTNGGAAEVAARTPDWRQKGFGYWLLVLAGLGIFCGCVGKSAQFPLHVWLPDAMEGPTPVSALVHSATMVAAGVYLVGRFFPVFTAEVLLVIAIIGTITMLLGASIAFTANDIKRVLAYSTVSQLGLMMLSLGVGGWLAGLLHLMTHAFFKSMLFMCSGSVIHAVHTNDMRKMGGLFWKMPVTAITMLIGCLAIAGVSVPFVVGFSGYYSKDAILEQAFAFWQTNQAPAAGVFFVLAVAGAAMTTTYMFRMWFLTFTGQPRDDEAYDHAHESPPVMYLPLVVLSVLAVCVAWNYQYIGYFAVAGAFFVGRGWQKGWFKSLRGEVAHGHADHAVLHDTPEDAHGPRSEAQAGGVQFGPMAHHLHDTHQAPETQFHVSEHGALHHGHDEHHGHGHAHGPLDLASVGLTWSWLAVMLVSTVVIGGLVHKGIGATWRDGLSLKALLEQARPEGTLATLRGAWTGLGWPSEHYAHEAAQFGSVVVPSTLLATASWVSGILLAAAFYWWGALKPDDVRRQFAPVYSALVNKWWFDELYDAIFVQPTMVLARVFASIDRRWIDGFLEWLAASCVRFARAWEYVADQSIVDGLVNLIASWTYSLGLSLRGLQTGQLRQYVLFIVIGAVAIFVLISFFWSPTLAAR